MYGQYRGAPVETYATWDPPGPDFEVDAESEGFQRSLVRHNPISVGTTFVLESLIGIDEVNFCEWPPASLDWRPAPCLPLATHHLQYLCLRMR